MIVSAAAKTVPEMQKKSPVADATGRNTIL